MLSCFSSPATGLLMHYNSAVRQLRLFWSRSSLQQTRLYGEVWKRVKAQWSLL